MSDWLLRCKGCGCAYIRGEKNGPDFCEFCCREIKESPVTFRTLEQKEAQKAIFGKTQEKKRK